MALLGNNLTPFGGVHVTTFVLSSVSQVAVTVFPLISRDPNMGLKMLSSWRYARYGSDDDPLLTA
jgi:hypothetical protein